MVLTGVELVVELPYSAAGCSRSYAQSLYISNAARLRQTLTEELPPLLCHGARDAFNAPLPCVPDVGVGQRDTPKLASPPSFNRNLTPGITRAPAPGA